MNPKTHPIEENFDFDDWAKLARSDPAAFDLRREEFIAAQIERHPAERRERLVCLQWRLDEERQRTSSALGACIRFSGKMWDAFTRLDDALNRVFTEPPERVEEALAPPDSGEKIIPFLPRQVR